MTLAYLFKTESKNSLADDSGSWRQFILDHLDYIRKRSKTYQIKPELMNLYRYDLKRFLVNDEDLSRDGDITWIVQRLNNLPNDFSFVDIDQLIIPSNTLIETLYGTYSAIVANAA